MQRKRILVVQGFTLIELLVVIAIIGVLTSVVLVSLNATREKAKIARAKIEIDQIMKAAELVFDEYGYYPNDSHGSIVCPKDIIIKETPSRIWGYFIDICNDPWGNPYEWDNQCSGGGTRPLAHEAPDPSCPSYSDTNPGPIGVTVVSSDGINNGCIGDDLCNGSRGHIVYGYDGQITPSTGPMCINVISNCDGLSAIGCVSRSSCALGGYGCSGSYDDSCSSLVDQTSCSASTGCSWSVGGCGGTATLCNLYGDSPSCNASSGCNWNTSSSCGGTASACNTTNYGTQTSCQGAGCSWGTSSSCSGSYLCSQWDHTNAITCTDNHPNCTWTSGQGGRCNGGSQSCSTLQSASTCSIPNGCSWNTSNTCSGSPNTCLTYGNSSSCNGASGCSWSSSSSCVGSANCSYGDSSSCSAVGCSWSAPSCQGTHSTNCDGLSSQSSCQTQATCTWSEGACTGTASSCTNYADQNSCTSQSGCSWE